MIFPHKFSSGDYSSVYYSDEENIVGLLHLTTESDYIPEAEIIYGELVDTIEYDIMEATEIKKFISVMTMIISVGRNMKWMSIIPICIMPLIKI